MSHKGTNGNQAKKKLNLNKVYSDGVSMKIFHIEMGKNGANCKAN